MNILILYTKNRQEVFNRKSAIGSYIHCLALILNENGINVSINGEDFSDIETTTIRSSEFQKNKIKNLISSLIPTFFKRLINDTKHIFKLKNFLQELKDSSKHYDAVLEFYNFGSNIGYLISQQKNIPLYITYDGPILEEYSFFYGGKSSYKRIVQKRERQSLKVAKKIVVYSNPMVSFVQSITGIRENILIHQNVDFSRFDIMKTDKNHDDKCINICFIGSFLKWHQIDLLVDSFAYCIKGGLSCKLFLIGDGMERERIEAYVSSFNEDVKSKIEFTGFVDGKDLFELKKEMHIGVMPGSNWYGAPNKIFEYGAMKMAVIAPDTPTIVDLFNESEVLFFDWKKGQSLSKKLNELVTDSAKMQSFSHTLNNRILEKYSVSNTSDFYLKLLKG